MAINGYLQYNKLQIEIKNDLIVINLINNNIMTKTLLAALAVSSTLFVGCQPSTTAIDASVLTPATPVVEMKKSGGIVYINSDSLVSSYNHYKDLKSKFDVKAAKVQKQLENKTRSLERKVADFQNKIEKGLVTRATAAEMEQKLTVEQQSVLKYRDKVLAELQEEERVLFNNINNDVDVYLKKYNAEKNYDLILNTNGNANTVLISNPTFNVTAEVLEGLNADYAASKSAETPGAPKK